MPVSPVQAEIAAAAAPWVLEHGLDYTSAKRKARDALGLGRVELPDNPTLEDALREHIALYLSDTQPQELLALRELACRWMARLAAFNPRLCGAVWKGTATLRSPVVLQLYADDPKMVDIWLLNERIAFELHESSGVDGQPAPLLCIDAELPSLREWTQVQLLVQDVDAMRVAKTNDARGMALRGDLAAVERKMTEEANG